MDKREFLSVLKQGVREVVEQELIGTGWSAEHCPWLEYWFAYYAARSASDVEASLRKYARPARDATQAADYIPHVLERVRSAVAHWRRTGEVDAPVAEIPEAVETVTALGPGSELDSSVRSRMATAAGADLRRTRIHDDALGARVASAEGARAVAIGSHIAFAPGEYAPGTVFGDALLGHELAHTLQQRDPTVSSSGATDAAIESQADTASIGILGRLWGNVTSWFAAGSVAQTGLRLQRCKETNGLPEPAKGAVPDYDAFSNAKGESARTDKQAEAWAAMFQNRDQLDRVFADANSGNARAKQVVAELLHFWEETGREIARKEASPDCMVPAWRELKQTVATGCEPNWGYISFLRQDRVGGIALREAIAKGYSQESRKLGVRNTIIANGLTLLLVGWQTRAALAAERQALGVEANVPKPRPAPERVKIPDELRQGTAAEAAESLKLPPAPEGYVWGKFQGQLVLKRKPGTATGPNAAPKLRYDPATRRFIDESALKPPKKAVVAPSVPPKELEAAANEAAAVRDGLPKPQGAKTVAGTSDGTTKTSGWGSDVSNIDPVAKLSKQIGHTPEPHPMDAKGHPGSYHNSHAEKQVAAQTGGAKPIGVSKAMCLDCQMFFKKLAKHRGKPVVVADPSGIRVFMPDGSVFTAKTGAGLLVGTTTESEHHEH